MAFNKDYLARGSVALNTGMVIASGSEPASPTFFTYRSASDAAATVAAANYFASAVWQLSVNDLLYCSCSDAVSMLTVATIDRAAGTITTVAASLTGAVDTANLVDGAVTNAKVNASAAIAFSKLATLTSGNILVGSVGNVPTSVAMAGDITIIAAGTTAIGANKVLSSMVSPLLLKYATVAISAAEFNGMYAAPKALVAAGGANTLLVLEQLQLLMTYGTAAYAAGGVAAVQYDSTVNGAGVIASTTLAAAVFQATASTGFTFNKGVVAETFTTCVNKGFYLSNVTGAFTTGDSAMVAHIWYRLIPTV